jgi:tetratricopeptide (TPR) repeat protein
MTSLGTRGFRLGLLALLAGVFSLFCVYKARRSERVPFLAACCDAEWVVFPSAPSAAIRRTTPLETEFRRTFELASAPTVGRLELRGFTSLNVTLNGVELPSAGTGSTSWKDPSLWDVRPALRAGSNELRVRVTNERGPPALWAKLTTDSVSILSDAEFRATCAGSAERPVRLASVAMTEWGTGGASSAVGPRRSDSANPTPWKGLRDRWGTLALVGVLATLIVTWIRRRPIAWTPATLAALVAALGLAHALLFWNNRGIAPSQGFDALAHLDYVAHVFRTWSVPLADEGWEMYQPPAWYFLAAAAWKLFGVTPGTPESLAVLRMLAWLALALQLVAVAGTLWEVCRSTATPKIAAVGVVFAALLPMQLYLFSFPTNESWAATWIALALWLAVRSLVRGARSWLLHATIGALLGLALLTKFSGLLALCGVVALLAAKALWGREARVSTLIRTAGIVAFVAVALATPYYAKVYERFGEILVWNLDDVTGFAWWQDPGYHVAGDYFRFGESLVRPLLSSFAGIPDALFSTLWSDGMLGGSARVDVRPPWDYSLLAALVPWGLLASALIVWGVFEDLRAWIERGEYGPSLLFGLAGVTLAALISLTLDLPTFAQAKSIYAASVVAALALAFARGYVAACKQGPAFGAVLEVLLLTGGVLSYVSFWSSGAAREAGLERLPSAEQVPSKVDLLELSGGDRERALDAAQREVGRAPDQAWAHRNLAFVLFKTGDREAALRAAREGLAVDPWNADLHRLVSALLASGPEAAEHNEWAALLEPTHVPSVLRAAQARRDAGDVESARRILLRASRALPEGLGAERQRVETALSDLSGR